MIKELAKGLAFTLKKMGTARPSPSSTRRSRSRYRRAIAGGTSCTGTTTGSSGASAASSAQPRARWAASTCSQPRTTPSRRSRPGERYAERYEINLMRCIYCGYCAEACPTEAITLGPRFELADYRRERTVVTKAELLESWPGFAQAQRPASPVGAGADQTGREDLDPGVRPRAAWAAQERTLDTRDGAASRGSWACPSTCRRSSNPGRASSGDRSLRRRDRTCGRELARRRALATDDVLRAQPRAHRGMLAVLFLLLNAQFLFAAQLSSMRAR